MQRPRNVSRKFSARLALNLAIICLASTLYIPSISAQENTTSSTGSSPQTKNIVMAAGRKALEEMGHSLAQKKTLAYDIDMKTDVVLSKDKVKEVGGKVKIRFMRPNKLFVDLKTDSMEREFYHDGNDFTVVAVKEGYVGKLPARSSTRAALIMAATEYGLEIPLVDLLEWGTDQAADLPIESAKLIAETKLNGKPVEHWAFRSNNLDWEIWISKGVERLPLRITTVDYQEPAQPRFQADIHWLDPSSVNEDDFSPKLSADLKPIPFTKVQQHAEGTQ